MWIKICGITNQYDAMKTYEAGADSLGLVFYKKSPRNLDISRAYAICSELTGKNISFTGIFVNEAPKKVLEISNSLHLSYLQFSGQEDIGYLKKIKEASRDNANIKIIKTLRISDPMGDNERSAILQEIKCMREVADYILLDTFSTQNLGGTGQPFDWKMLKNIGKEHPIILSGGLEGENVKEAIKKISPWGIDASSRLESSPGKKDINKVNHFINSARE